MSNSPGKTLTIFIVLVVILLLSATSIGFYLYNKEIQMRQQAQNDLEISHTNEMKLQATLKEAQRQLAIAQDKNKEADDKINNLMDEMDLNEGLRKELKTENASLKEKLDLAQKEKDKVKAAMDASQKTYDDQEKKYKQVQELLKSEQDKSGNLQNSITQLEKEKADARAKIEAMKADLKAFNPHGPDDQAASTDKVQLDKIVVNPNGGIRGRILSIDKEAEFIVCNLGIKQGVKSNDILSVYRGEEYLGDVKVSRAQEELSAADIIPPFSSRKVRKNDTVVFNP
jgi:hypothetical protein